MNTQLLKAKLKYHNRTYQEIANIIHIQRDTFARRLAKGTFTARDISGMMKAIPLSIEEVEEIFLK